MCEIYFVVGTLSATSGRSAIAADSAVAGLKHAPGAPGKHAYVFAKLLGAVSDRGDNFLSGYAPRRGRGMVKAAKLVVGSAQDPVSCSRRARGIWTSHGHDPFSLTCAGSMRACSGVAERGRKQSLERVGKSAPCEDAIWGHRAHFLPLPRRYP